MADSKVEEHKRLDAEELTGLALSAEDFTNLICDCIQVTDTIVEIDNDGTEIHKEVKCNLPFAIGAIIVAFFRIQNQTAYKVGDELWVRMETQDFQKNIAYMKLLYPWATKGRKLNKDADCYLEGLELWERYRQKYKLIDDYGSVLTNDKLQILKTIVKALPNRAKKHASSDLITLYGTYNLFSSFGVATRDIIGSGPIKKDDFEFHWELYGDNVENLGNHLTTDDINEWRPAVDKIQNFKNRLYPEIMNALFPFDKPNAKVRHIHLSTDMFRDRTKYIYDMYIGQDAVLFQRVHSD
eukprot:413167_1